MEKRRRLQSNENEYTTLLRQTVSALLFDTMSQLGTIDTQYQLELADMSGRRHSAMTSRIRRLLSTLILFVLINSGCSASGEPAASTGQAGNASVDIVTSTSIIGDVVHNVAGDAATITVLMPAGTDPHTYEATPQDTAAMSDADVVFINGLGLEASLQPMLDAIRGETRIVALSEEIEPLAGPAPPAGAGEEHDGSATDPHVWFDPNNVVLWTDVIEQTLTDLDPEHSQTYEANADAYRTELEELDSWIREEIAQIPPDRRNLVTDHTVFTYFADEYGFRQVGAVVPGASTMAEPSAQEMAALQNTIEEYQVPAIFVSETVNPQLAEQVASDTGVEIRRVYTGSLSSSDGPASSYIDYMRYDVSTIVDALK